LDQVFLRRPECYRALDPFARRAVHGNRRHVRGFSLDPAPPFAQWRRRRLEL
jgi:hypothetical protein